MKIEKEFIPYEQSLDLKELGFDELCICIYNREKSLRVNVFNNPNDRFKSVRLSYNNGKIPAPLYQQAFRWFREKYKLQAEILWRGDMECFCYKTGNFKYGSHVFSEKDYKTYEEAELECLKKLIEICSKLK